MLHAQEDDTTLMNEAEGKLKQGVSVSAILTDIKYASLHPATSFREPIKKYSKAETVSIAIDIMPVLFYFNIRKYRVGIILISIGPDELPGAIGKTKTAVS